MMIMPMFQPGGGGSARNPIALWIVINFITIILGILFYYLYGFNIDEYGYMNNIGLLACIIGFCSANLIALICWLTYIVEYWLED